MGDTRMLLNRISALRQRLEQVQGLVSEAGSAAAALLEPPANPAPPVEQRLAHGARQHALLDHTLRQLAGYLMGPNDILPTRLTARARLLLERGRALVGELKQLVDEPALHGALPLADLDASEVDPLPLSFRELAGMTESTLRLVQAFPDSASTQLRLCDGLEGILDGIRDRITQLAQAAVRRRQEQERIDQFAEWLTRLDADQAMPLTAFQALAEQILAEVQAGQPLRFHQVNLARPVFIGGVEPSIVSRFVASHSLNVASVIASMALHHAEWRSRPATAVIAALLHDLGMMRVPLDLLTRQGSLPMPERRIVERHVADGTERIARLLAPGADVVEAIATHHERLDGTGYPGGRKNGQLGSLGKLLAVADVYAALNCTRPYRPALDPRTALTDTLLLAERGLLDRGSAELLLHLGFYPVGSVVELADGRVARVVAVHPYNGDLSLPGRPVLALLTDEHGQLLPVPESLDLAVAERGTIVRAVPATIRRRLLARRYPELA